MKDVVCYRVQCSEFACYRVQGSEFGCLVCLFYYFSVAKFACFSCSACIEIQIYHFFCSCVTV